MRICQLSPITTAANVTCAASQSIGNVSASFANVVKKAFQSIANFFARIKNGTVCFLKNRVTCVKNGACFLKDKVVSLFRKKVAPQGSNPVVVQKAPADKAAVPDKYLEFPAVVAPAVVAPEGAAPEGAAPEGAAPAVAAPAVAEDSPEAIFAKIVENNSKWKKLSSEKQEKIKQNFVDKFAQIKDEAIANAPNTRGAGQEDQQAKRVEAALKVEVKNLIKVAAKVSA